MIKTFLIGAEGPAFESSLNEFIKDKKVIDIKYQAYVIPKVYSNGVPIKTSVCDRALVIYEELGPDELKQAIQEMQDSGRAFVALHQALQKKD